MSEQEPQLGDSSGEREHRAGFVALLGRPNAGKSTLLNRLVGEKVAIVSDKPQTTRTQIRGILTRPEGQVVFVDTPGIHKPGYALNRRMMSSVADALASVDLVLLLVDATSSPGAGDAFARDLVARSGKPALLVLNKVDRVRNKSALLPILESRSAAGEYVDVVPISAAKGTNVDTLVDLVISHLPEGPPLFAEDEYTDQPMRTLAAELVREQILQAMGEELPYVTAVLVERWEETDDLATIYCLVLVERSSQKAIVIGKGGQQLKEIGTRARLQIEEILGKRVFLQIHVTVREQWRNDERVLRSLGLDEGER
jgi:GTP-binding protein Era